MSEPTPEPNHEAEPKPKERCRAITTSGHRCKSDALCNGHLCWPHLHHRNPVLPDPTHVAIPLLEDHASVQLVLSQIAHGLLTHKLDPERARALVYTCQVATATMPRPPRMLSPQPQPPHLTPDSTGAKQPRPAAWGPWPEEEEDRVYRLALDYEGLISGDGDLPAPSAHWQPPSPEATPWDLIHAAPNQSKPTPRDPSDPDTHCSCGICYEIGKMKADPWSHPHLQPVVNPYCKRNQAGCEGPASSNRCSYCDAIYRYDPRKYDRLRSRARTRHPEPSEEGWTEQEPQGTQSRGTQSRVPHPSRSAFPSERVGSLESEPGLEPRVPHPSRRHLGERVGDREPQPDPNPLPDQFPDDDPMIKGPLDLKANTEHEATGHRPPATGYRLQPPSSRPPAPSSPQGNTQNLLPSNPFPISKTSPPQTRGVPPEPETVYSGQTHRERDRSRAGRSAFRMECDHEPSSAPVAKRICEMAD